MKNKVAIGKIISRCIWGAFIGFYIWNAFLLIPSDLQSSVLTSSELSRALSVNKATVEESSSSAVNVEPTAAPVAINIPSIGVNTDVLPSGNTSDGSTMEVPYDFKSVFWYKYSSFPGGNGNSIFAAHVDGFYGKPAIFWNLTKVNIGEGIYIATSANVTYTYIIKSKEIVSKDNSQKWVQIMNPQNDQKLITLITCAGDWIPSQRTRTDRVVITAELLK